MHSWCDAAHVWLVEKQHKASIERDRAVIAWLHPHFGALLLADLDRDAIVRVARLKAVESSPATANRMLALVRSILRRAMHIWGWLDRVPHIELYPERVRRVRWLTPTQARSLLQHLPAHQQATVLFALATGLRQANVVRLEWSQVDLPRRMLWVYASQAKGRRDFSIPLNDTAMSVLRRCEGVHPARVFTYRRRPFVSANTRAWRNALRRAGVEDFRWHDLRHTWASWHVQHGTPLFVVQDLGAWSSEQMVRRYAHLAPSQYVKHAAVLDDDFKII